MKRVVLLGSPVAHSLSPVIQNAAFQVSGLDWCYEAIETEAEELEPALDRMRAEAWPGANVTLPLKEAVVPLLDVLDPSAVEVSAVNTIVNEGGRLVGVFAMTQPPRAAIVTRSHGDFGSRPLFDAAVPVLPGLERRPAFVF